MLLLGGSALLAEWALLRTLSLSSPPNNPAPLQTQCNIPLSTSTDNRLSEPGRKKETTAEEGNRDAVGNHWPLKTFFKVSIIAKMSLL